MLFKAKTLKGYKLDSLDGEIGEIKEFYFDDRHWTIRYLVADTGNNLTIKRSDKKENRHANIRITLLEIGDNTQ